MLKELLESFCAWWKESLEPVFALLLLSLLALYPLARECESRTVMELLVVRF
jgi:hypothetical protein